MNELQLSVATAMDTDALIRAKKAADGGYSKQPPNVSNYWAACPPEEIGRESQAKVDKYYNFVISSNLVELWRRSYRAYYGMRQSLGASGWGIFDVGQLVPSGDQGEIIRVHVNHYANLINHQMAMTCGQRPALECRAVNSDAESLVSASIGNGVTEYFMRERKLERNYFQGVETGLVTSEGYIVLGWDPTAGKQYGQGPNGSIQFDGDLTARNFSGFDVVKDVTKNTDGEQTWYITVSRKNKYDLMAKYPHLEEEIDKISPDEKVVGKIGDPSRIIAGAYTSESDDIPYKELYHAVTDSMPEGRYTIFLNGDVVLFDGPLPFRSLSDVIHRIAPQNIISTPFGWARSFDILALQELLNKLYTVVSTNTLGAGIQNFWSPPGNNVMVSQLAGGFNLVESITKPEVLALLNTPAEVYKFIDKVEGVMETLMNIGSINRGEIPSGAMSGSAMAFAASQSITSNSGIQTSANQGLESMGTGMVNILKDYATTKRIAVVAGKQNQPQMLSYMGKDLERINNVVCDATAALSKTLAGKISIADNLLAAGKIDTPQEYLTLMQTGQLEPMTRGPTMENFLIQKENEEMLKGGQPPVLRIDTHQQHIIEHKTLLSTPASRRDPRIVQLVLGHIEEHEKWQLQMQQTDPTYLAATRQQPLPAPQQPAPGGPPPPAGAPGGNAGVVNAASPVAQQAEKVRQPNMPSLPKGADDQTRQSFEKIGGQ